MMLSGAAPLPKHVEEFLRVTSCSVLIQGYGTQELHDLQSQSSVKYFCSSNKRYLLSSIKVC